MPCRPSTTAPAASVGPSRPSVPAASRATGGGTPRSRVRAASASSCDRPPSPGSGSRERDGGFAAQDQAARGDRDGCALAAAEEQLREGAPALAASPTSGGSTISGIRPSSAVRRPAASSARRLVAMSLALDAIDRPDRRLSASPGDLPSRSRSDDPGGRGRVRPRARRGERVADLSRRRRIGHARSRSDGRQIVADDVGHDVAAHVPACASARASRPPLQRVNRLRTRFMALMSRPESKQPRVEIFSSCGAMPGCGAPSRLVVPPDSSTHTA